MFPLFPITWCETGSASTAIMTVNAAIWDELVTQAVQELDRAFSALAGQCSRACPAAVTMTALHKACSVQGSQTTTSPGFWRSWCVWSADHSPGHWTRHLSWPHKEHAKEVGSRIPVLLLMEAAGKGRAERAWCTSAVLWILQYDCSVMAKEWECPNLAGK